MFRGSKIFKTTRRLLRMSSSGTGCHTQSRDENQPNTAR